MPRLGSPDLSVETQPLIESEWQPDLQRPHIAVYGLEDVSPIWSWFNHAGMESYLRDFGTHMTEELLDKAQSIDFPATDPTTLVDEGVKDSTFFPMRYVPNLFDHVSSPELSKLANIYENILPLLIHAELDETVGPMTPGERSAEAFIVDPSKGESLDPHRDERTTVAFYPNSGLGLIVSHATNARTFEDMAANPVTLVLPGAASFVVFNGIRHPHIGVSLGLNAHDTEAERRDKMQRLYDRFKIVDFASNLFEEIIVKGRPERVINDEYLLTASGREAERLVVSMNFDSAGEQTLDVQQSSLDSIFQQAASTTPPSNRKK